ncbi:MAG TPA: 30S ribosome-binding factor RbfA [Phycisphaerae bacterium]|nr:30S ribosome-binding factor RbfA [Phycisphaerae bacterium]
MSRRTERVASLIRDVVADAIPRMNDPRLEPLTSITRVEVSSDLSIARLNVSVLAESEARRNLSVEALRGAAGRLRTLLREHLYARQVPRLEFHLDESLRRGFQVVQTIERVMESQRPPADEPPDDRPACDGEPPAAEHPGPRPVDRAQEEL